MVQESCNNEETSKCCFVHEATYAEMKKVAERLQAWDCTWFGRGTVTKICLREAAPSKADRLKASQQQLTECLASA